jgi:UPF0042 nucleotide-binding protein
MQIHLITGISGSGKSVALKAFEDSGYDCVDNLPVPLLQALVQTMEKEGREFVAVAIDARRGQSISELPTLLETLRAKHHVRILFLNADTSTLVQRFSETRRRHPLSGNLSAAQNQASTLTEAIERERNLLAPLREQAHSIDTSNLPSHTLRAWIHELLKEKPNRLTLILESFGFKKGVPSEADLVFDVRCLPNPHYDKVLRPLTGHDAPVKAFLEALPVVNEMEHDIIQFVQKWLPSYIADGRSYLTVAIGCTGGQHRSVYLVDRLMDYFSRQPDLSSRVHLIARHRELDSNPLKAV